jgi:hypothetical protein
MHKLYLSNTRDIVIDLCHNIRQYQKVTFQKKSKEEIPGLACLGESTSYSLQPGTTIIPIFPEHYNQKGKLGKIRKQIYIR